MEIGARLRQIREEKQMSQGVIEQRTGLLRCYVSRVENGFTVPAIETLEKFARALEVPLYQLFYDGDHTPKPLKVTSKQASSEWGGRGKDVKALLQLRRLLGRMKDRERIILLAMAQKMAGAHRARGAAASN
jgi:transcriptional regulator with XRE-family HTH domain